LNTVEKGSHVATLEWFRADASSQSLHAPFDDPAAVPSSEKQRKAIRTIITPAESGDGGSVACPEAPITMDSTRTVPPLRPACVHKFLGLSQTLKPVDVTTKF